MASEKQIAANRLNALLSTGPRTEAGKERSARNSLRHGLAAQGVIVTEDQQEHFQRFRDGLNAFLSPYGPVQSLLFHQIVVAAWNLQRCERAAAELFLQSGIDPLLDIENQAKYDRIQRYARQHESSFFRAMRELSSLQNEIAFRKRAFPITCEQRTDGEFFSSSPHAASDLCRFSKVMDMVKRHAKSAAPEVEAPLSETKPIPPTEEHGEEPPPANTGNLLYTQENLNLERDPDATTASDHCSSDRAHPVRRRQPTRQRRTKKGQTS